MARKLFLALGHSDAAATMPWDAERRRLFYTGRSFGRHFPPNNMLTYLLTFVHVIVCFFLIVVVLLQSGKAADLAGAFGGMGSQTTFGPRGSATVLSKATTAAAVIFMITSMWLSILATRHSGTVSSVLDSAKSPKPAATKPQAPRGQPPMPNIQVQQRNGQPQQAAPAVPLSQKPAQK